LARPKGPAVDQVVVVVVVVVVAQKDRQQEGEPARVPAGEYRVRNPAVAE
jgi:hypothetical protein